MTELVFRPEKTGKVASEAALLARDHWNEVEAPLFGKDDYLLDNEHYVMLESLNMLAVITAREARGELAGYAVFILAPCGHLKGELVAVLDALYLVPAARRGFNALQLLRSAEAHLAERGASLVQYSSPASRPCAALYRRLGARESESIWHKRLGSAKPENKGE